MACAAAGEKMLLGLPSFQNATQPNSTVSALGRTLFFDKQLSRDQSISCASCHIPEKAFSDGRALAVGISGKSGTRNTPSLLNVAFNRSLFWDGRRHSLEEQASDPLVNPREHGMPDTASVLSRLRKTPAYQKQFRDSFGVEAAGMNFEMVRTALASYERSLLAGNSSFDRAYFGGDDQALSARERNGLELFRGRARCATCHVIGDSSALFTDHQFHSLSVGLRKVAGRLDEITTQLVRERQEGKSLDATILSEDDVAELGRFAVTLRPADIGKFRTPSLRNVALTAPYMHDGSVPNLEAAVQMELYSRGVNPGKPIILTPAEKADLVLFLGTLSSGDYVTRQ